MSEQEPNISKVAIYMRVSTEEQAQGGFSLDSQLERLRAYCMAREWTIEKEYVDPGYSGRKTHNRPAYSEMMRELDHFDGIVVIKMDRIHRNSSNFTKMMRSLKDSGKQFISMSESLDTSTAMGRFVADIISRIAQLESEQTGERVKWGMKQKASDQDAGFVGHRTPYGYKWNKIKKKLDPIPEQIQEVKTAFQLYLQGASMREIGRELGKSNTTIRYWLHNCVYTGFERWEHHFKKAEIEPIISISDYNTVQELFRDRCKTHRNYNPLRIVVGKTKLTDEEAASIPIINRPKQNFVGWE